MNPTQETKMKWFKDNNDYYSEQRTRKNNSGYHNDKMVLTEHKKPQSDYEQAKTKTQRLFSFFVGSNNKTHKLELDKLESILKLFTDGYSIQFIKGSWHGISENTAKVEIVTDKLNIRLLAETIKKQLQQESIMVTIQKPHILFI